MGKWANPGTMNTKIFILKPTGEKNADGTTKDEMYNIFGEGEYRYCHWVNAHGRDRFEAFKFGKADTATLTMRYSRLITPDCIIIKIDDKFKYDCYSGETEQWEIEDADDVENRHAWLEIFVKRWEKAK